MSETAAPPHDSPAPAAAPWLPRPLLIRAVLESALIVLSVFLALFLDEWRAEREADARVETARDYLVREVRSNLQRLQSDPVLPYHVRTHTLLQKGLGPAGPEQQAALQRLRGGAFTGVHPFRAQDVAWTTFRTAEVTQRLPAEELFLLAKIYDAQESLRAISEASYAGLIQPSGDYGSESFERSQAEAVRAYFADAIPIERDLLALYQRALEALEDEGPAPRPAG